MSTNSQTSDRGPARGVTASTVVRSERVCAIRGSCNGAQAVACGGANRRRRSSGELAHAGRPVELGVELHSVHIAAGCGERRVEHLVLSPALADIGSNVPEREWPVTLGVVEWSLYDHLLRFHELLEQTGHHARIRQPGRLERLGELWGRLVGPRRTVAGA
jgi:hypothetical protein